MRFYNASRRVFPRNYPLRMFALCFGAVHVPLAGFLLLGATTGEFSRTIFAALLLATVVGSGIAIAGIAGLLAPVRAATEAMSALRDGRPCGAIPAGGEDMAGELLASVAYAVRSTRQQIAQLEGIAGADMLTGLRNRRGFFAEIDRRGSPGGVVVIFDGDGFKAVNDDLGHTRGDEVLAAMGKRLAERFGEQAVLARWGGDEFLAFFPEAELGDVVPRLEQFEWSLSKEPLVEGRMIFFTCGYARLLTGSLTEIEGAIELADRMMYGAKPKRRARDGSPRAGMVA